MTIFWAIWLSATILVLIFGAVLLVGAPYLPTLAAQRAQALQLLNLKPGQTLYELGSGDGSLLVEAARQGIYVVGFELNPILFIISWLRTRRYRQYVKIRWSNFWNADLAGADAIFVFLLDRFMSQLDAKIKAEQTKKLKLVSYAFKIPGKKSSKKFGPLYLYIY